MSFFLWLEIKKRLNTNLKLSFVFFSILIFITGCTKKSPSESYALTAEERVWMESFFTGLMLQNRAIYTLCGSKPITIMTLDYYTDEEIQAYYDQMTEEQKTTAIYVEDYQLSENWEKWKKISSRFPLKRYLLFKKDDTNNPKTSHVYFLDPIKVAQIMKENYDLFKEAAGCDFNPLQEALCVEKGSIFWEKLKGNVVINGLLFGFGKKNSLKFYWNHWGQPENAPEFANAVEPYASDSLKDGKSTLENLTLPAFTSFFKEDEVIEKYKKERDAIRSEYQGKDFLEYTLQKLTSQ